MSRLKKYLNSVEEEFVIGYRDLFDNYKEIFKNPSRKEYLEITEEDRNFRFIADKNKKDLYVADVGVLHEDIQKQIGMKTHYFDLFSGIAFFEGNYINISYDNLNCNIDDEILEGDYDWVRKYKFDIRKLKEDILDYNYSDLSNKEKEKLINGEV